MATTNRLQKWAIKLMAFTYEIEYRKSQRNANEDALLRLPGGPDPDFHEKNTLVYQLDKEVIADSIPIDHKTVAKDTASDEVLRQIFSFVTSVWPVKVSGRLRPYFALSDQLVEDDGVLIH